MAKNTVEPDPFEVAMKQFPRGAKVQLNVGGPVMAVKTHDGYNRDIVCQWFSGKKLELGHFAPETLLLVKDDAGQEKQSA